MKWISLVFFAVFLAAAQGLGFGSTYDHHYEQHRQSIDAAQHGLKDQFGSASIQLRPAGYDCSACLQQESHFDSGFGAGFKGSYVSGVQPGFSSSLSSSSSSSSNSFGSNLNTITVPVSGKSENSLFESKLVSKTESAPIVTIANTGGSERYKLHEEKHSQLHTAPIQVIPSGGASESYIHESQQQRVIGSAPLIVVPNESSKSYQHHHEKLIKSQATPIVQVLTPSGTSESFISERQKVIESQSPVHSQLLVSSPVYGYGSDSSFQRTHSGFTGSYPSIQLNPSVNSEYNEYKKVAEKIQSTPVVTYTPSVSGSSSSHSSFKEVHGSSGASYVPVSLGLTSSSSLNSASSQFGSNGLSHSLGLGSSSIDHYMSESERLARLQAQNINEGGIRVGGNRLTSDFESNNVNLGTVGVGVVGVGGAGGAGGRRSQSWEKSSKWASGSEYGHDGQLKNYNLLSTAESEDHDINGKKLGYKAATTTLDDNGKVSTYTIHT